MTIDIDQTIADLQTYAESLDQNGHFAVIVSPAWCSPYLILPNSRVNLADVLREELDSCDVDFSWVNSYAHGRKIYSETLNPPNPEKPKSEYKQLILEGVMYDLVPVD